MPKASANPKCTRHNDELRQWATAIVKKATPKMVKSLVESAESLAQRLPRPQAAPAARVPEEPKDESLAALLLRLLRTGENGATGNPSQTATTASENPSVG